VLPPGERRYTNPITDRHLLYTVDSRELWRYWSEAHQIYTRCSLIIATVNAHIVSDILIRIWMLVQTMQVVSDCLHYLLVSPIIIWLPWQRPLTNQKIRYRSIICTQSTFIWWKIENWPSISWDIRLNTPFFAVSYQTFTSELCQLWSYWTRVHEICTRYRGIIYAVNMHIEIGMSDSALECHSDKWGEFAIFHKICCHDNVPWDIGKRGPDRSSTPKMQNSFMSWKDSKTRSTRSWDNCSLSNH